MPIPEQLGPFRLKKLLGKGGMGAVYLAEHEGVPHPVALKVLLSQADGDPVRRGRFETEIETLRRLRHENIVRLIGFGEAEGYLYFAMEYVDGSSLEAELRRHRRFTWEESVHIGVHIAQALRHAHDRGIIHRDIKPANILLSTSGQIKVSDYGIAHLFGDHRYTAADTVIGTLDYMSPEQASSGPITPKSDLFSLGALLYAILTESPPFPLEKKTLPELLKRFREGPPESARLRRPDLPRDLDTLLLEMLSLDPNGRPPNAQIVQRRLESILEAHAAPGGLARFFPTAGSAKEDAETAEFSDGGERVTSSRVHLGATGAETADETMAGGDDGGDLDPDRTITTGVLGEKPAETASGSLSLEWTEEEPGAESAAKRPAPAAPLPEFTTVPEEEFNPYSSQERAPYLSLRTMVFLCVLILAAVVLGLMLRRPSADKIYSRIESRLEAVSGKDDADYFAELRSLHSDFDDFLSYYPNDPRADEVRKLNADLEFATLETLLTRQAERSVFRRSASLSLIESAYIEAYSVTQRDPIEGLRKFRAFLMIFSSVDEENSPYSRPAQCIRLARKQIEWLEKDCESREHLEREHVAQMLSVADSLDETDPGRAAQIREGLKEFYSNRPWAAEVFGEE